MKFIHLSDLHIGKRVNEFSMLSDQKYIFDQIIKIVKNENPNGIIIAGDVYDKAVPSAEAVQLFDNFLTELSYQKRSVFIVSGNHDSGERLSFGAKLMKLNGVYIASVFNGEQMVSLHDEFGKINIYMVPFVKPVDVSRCFPDVVCESYNDALKTIINSFDLDKSERNVLICHQFVTGAVRSDSEEISIGGIDNIEASIFEDFDYVALGHIHGPQNISKPTIRYCGSPLKYSFSEKNHKKSVTVVEFGAKGEISIDTIPLIPKRDLREIKGPFDKITAKQNYINTNIDDYIYITLTDENDILDALVRLRAIYPNIMKLDYDNSRTRLESKELETEILDKKTPIELFEEFYEKQNNNSMSQAQGEFVKKIIQEIWGDI